MWRIFERTWPVNLIIPLVTFPPLGSYWVTPCRPIEPHVNFVNHPNIKLKPEQQTSLQNPRVQLFIVSIWIFTVLLSKPDLNKTLNQSLLKLGLIRIWLFIFKTIHQPQTGTLSHLWSDRKAVSKTTILDYFLTTILHCLIQLPRASL